MPSLATAALACERRRHHRHPVALDAVLRFGGLAETCRVFDLSEGGAGVTGITGDFAPGDVVELHLDGLGSFPARIARRDHTTIGLELLVAEHVGRRLMSAIAPRLRTIH